LFGSELKTLFAHPLVKPVLDKTGICEIIGLGPAHSMNSGVFKNIYQLPPAHFLLYSERGMKLEEYWTLQSLPHEESEGETLVHVRELLLDAINASSFRRSGLYLFVGRARFQYHLCHCGRRV
jgi:asparagine synthase (glutamine-hydrolysing)